MRKTRERKIPIILSGMAAAMFLSFAAPSVSRAYVQASGIVTADAAKVRKEPSTQSDSMSSLLKGTMVTVIDETKDSAGSLWYKVSYENSTGYIRSDLMLKATTAEGGQAAASGTGKTNNGTQTATMTTTTGTSSAATAASKPAATQVTTIAETKAYVNYKSARVRQGASTQHEIVGSAAENTPVVITGEAKGTDGRKWYQVRYTNQNGREVVGFIRADLVTVGDPPAAAAPAAPAETPEEAPAETPAETPADQPEGGEGAAEGGEGTDGGEGGGGEQPAPEPEPAPEQTARPDYEMVYQANSEGVEEWFLLDNINNTQQSLENLRMWADTGERLTQEAEKQGSVQKIIIIVLAALSAILAVTVAILLFKLKDVYDDDEYDDDDDEDDDEEEEDEEEDDDDEEDEEEEEEIKRVVRRKRPVQEKPERMEKAERAGRTQRQEKPERAERPQRQEAAPAPRPAAKARPVIEKERRPIPVKKAEYEPEEETESRQPAAQKPQQKRKPKNFLIEDDEFEFEFLNMDDKK